jgi:hypothetical protein
LEQVQRAGLTGWRLLADGAYLFVAREQLWLTTDPSALERHLGGATLASSALYQRARGDLPGVGAHFCLFVDGQGFLNELKRQEVEIPPSLGAWQYGFVGVNFDTRETSGLLRLDEDSALAKAVANPGRTDEALLSLLPRNMSTMMAGDLSWGKQVADELSADSPDAQDLLGFLSARADTYGDVSAAFTGRVAYSSELLDHLVEMADLQDDRYSYAREQGQLTACKSNLRNIGTALEMYSTDWSGRYPESMDRLTPNYLRDIPECPAAEMDTYTASLQTGLGAPGNDLDFQDYYYFECQGHHHPTTPPNQPAYNAIQGLVVSEESYRSPPRYSPNSVLVLEVRDVAEAHRILNAYTHQPRPSVLTGCKSNLKNLATAMEMYSTDYSGRYPDHTAALVPNYLAAIPECPAAGQDTYSDYLQTGPEAAGNEAEFQDYYYFECHGHHHQELEADYPRYTAIVGLDEGPRRSTEDIVAEVKAPPVPTAPATYPTDDGVLLLDPGRKLALLTSGEAAETLARQRRTSPLPARLQDVVRWSKGDAVYLAFNDLEGVMESAISQFRNHPDPTLGPIAAKGLEALKRWSGELRDAQALRPGPEGLYYRSSGYNSSPAIGAATLAGAAVLIPNFVRARAQGQATSCKSNLKVIGTALEMYSTDYSGRYPDKLDLLIPNYLRYIPECPAAGADTYSEHFQTGPDAPGNSAGYQDYYHVECHGHFHKSAGIPENYPQYNGIEGLLTR